VIDSCFEITSLCVISNACVHRIRRYRHGITFCNDASVLSASMLSNIPRPFEGLSSKRNKWTSPSFPPTLTRCSRVSLFICPHTRSSHRRLRDTNHCVLTGPSYIPQTWATSSAPSPDVSAENHEAGPGTAAGTARQLSPHITILDVANYSFILIIYRATIFAVSQLVSIEAGV
jgi:hypothetical protein